jgi:hypothetical protein
LFISSVVVEEEEEGEEEEVELVVLKMPGRARTPVSIACSRWTALDTGNATAATSFGPRGIPREVPLFEV